MRRAFLNRVGEMIKSETDTVFYTIDIGMWAIRDVLRDYPERCSNIGIFEDGLFSIVAGMAKTGLIPTVFGIQPYMIERTLEQIKMDFAYQKLGANIVGTGAAVDYSRYGYSHYCAEDVSVIKSVPGCEFVAPGSPEQFIQLFNQAYRDGKPTFFRISDHPNQENNPDVILGKGTVMKRGRKATVLAISTMLDTVMKVCSDLDVTVLYYTTLEPFDRELLHEECKANKVIIVEPEYEGSFTYDIYKSLEGKAVELLEIGFPRKIFRNYGTYEEKMNYYGLDEISVREKIVHFIE